MNNINLYLSNLKKNLTYNKIKKVNILVREIYEIWRLKRKIFICGNGGSAANAIHIANDFSYGVGVSNGIRIDVEALPSNQSVITCLANDIGYENIFSEQIMVKGKSNDLLLIFSGSGNSNNLVKAIEAAKKKHMKIYGIIGFDGGKVKKLIKKNCLHFPVDDMQISEDLQLITMHICMQIISKKKI